MKDFDISSNNVILIGFTGILGFEYTKYLLKQGVNLLVGDYDDLIAMEKIKKLNFENGKLDFKKINLLDEKSILKFFEYAHSHFNGKLHSLINNAQVKPEGFYEEFRNYSKKTISEVLDGNLIGVSESCKHAINKFKNFKKEGSIVNISSTYGIVAADQRIYDGVKNIYNPNSKFTSPISYGISKAGVLHLTKYLASYYRNEGLRVNCLTPGGVYDNHDENFNKNYSRNTLLGRMARKDEYNSSIHFLISNASSYMTGSNLIIDGGWSVC